MGFEKGSLAFRIFFPSRNLTEDDIDRFASEALPPLNTLTEEEIHGWVGSRHLLDRHITPENTLLGGYFRLALAQAKRPSQKSSAQLSAWRRMCLRRDGRYGSGWEKLSRPTLTRRH